MPCEIDTTADDLLDLPASAPAVIDRCVEVLQEKADGGETGLDRHTAGGIAFTPFAGDPSVFVRWERNGEPRGEPEWALSPEWAMKPAPLPPGEDVCEPRSPVVKARARILFLHGGGYAYYSPRTGSYRTLTSRLAAATGLPVLAIDYRLVPEFLFPTPITDAVAALRWLWKNGPDGPSDADAVFVVGDSAGGGMVIATALSLIASSQPSTPLPTACVTISAYTDLSCSLPSYTTRAWNPETREGDPLFSTGNDPETIAADIADAIDTGRDYVGPGGDLRHPIASPVFADPELLAGLPPTLMVVGDAEVMLDDTLELHRRAVNAGATGMELVVYPRMWHDFVMFSDACVGARGALVEAVDAMERIAIFICEHAPPGACVYGPASPKKPA